MTDDLDRAIDARVAAYSPGAAPPFDALVARKRRRDRLRLAAAGTALSAVAVGGAFVVPGLVRHDGPAGLAASGAGRHPGLTTEQKRYALGYKIPPSTAPAADDGAVQRCLRSQGTSDVDALLSDPAMYRVTVTGRDEIAAFEQCAHALPGVVTTEIADSGLSGSPVARTGRCTDAELRFSATWRAGDLGLAGEIRAVNVGDRACDMAGRPIFRVLDQDGQDLGAQQVADAVGRVYTLPLKPGEAASSAIVWPSWCGKKAAGGRLRVIWNKAPGMVVDVAGPTQPACTHTRVPEQLYAGYFEAGDSPK